MDKRQEVDYVSFARGSRVIILGEVSHHNASLQREVARSLKQLKYAGFTHFGMEMLPTDIDLGNTLALKRHFEDAWTPGHYAVLARAKQLNYKLLTLDMPYEKQQQYSLTQDGENSQYTDRNKWMTGEIIKALEQGAKPVLYVHNGHTISGTTSNIPDSKGIKALLLQAGIKAVTLKILGGDFSKEGGICSPSGRFPISVQALNAGLENTLFSVPGSASDGVDYIVHTPQDCTKR